MQCVVPEKWAHIFSPAFILKMEVNAFVSFCMWRSKHLPTASQTGKVKRLMGTRISEVFLQHQLNWLKGRCGTTCYCYLAILSTDLECLSSVAYLLGQQTGVVILSVGKAPSGTLWAGSLLDSGGYNRWCMGQKVTESSITKSGPMLGVPGKTPDMETIFEANAA